MCPLVQWDRRGRIQDNHSRAHVVRPESQLAVEHSHPPGIVVIRRGSTRDDCLMISALNGGKYPRFGRHFGRAKLHRVGNLNVERPIEGKGASYFSIRRIGWGRCGLSAEKATVVSADNVLHHTTRG